MERLEIHGYKSINHLNLELKPINILIGANGSGKSNFLSFFDFLKQLFNQNLQEYIALKGVDRFLHKDDKVSDQITAYLTFRHNTNANSFTLKKGDSGFLFAKETLFYEEYNSPTALEIASFNKESLLRLQTSEYARLCCDYLKALTKYHFHDTGDNSPFYRESNIDNDKFFLYEKGENLAAFLYNIYLEHRIVYNLIVKTIQSIAPYFLDFKLAPEKNGNIKLRWEDKYSKIYGVSDLSDGTIRFIALTILFMQPELPETIIIDEPELGLHPAAIAKLAGLIQSAAAKGCQIIMATQSTDLIGYFEAEDLITVDQINGESIFKRLNSEDLKQWLEEYPIEMSAI